MCVCMCVCACVRACVYIHVCVYMCICVCVCVRIYVLEDLLQNITLLNVCFSLNINKHIIVTITPFDLVVVETSDWCEKNVIGLTIT